MIHTTHVSILDAEERIDKAVRVSRSMRRRIYDVINDSFVVIGDDDFRWISTVDDWNDSLEAICHKIIQGFSDPEGHAGIEQIYAELCNIATPIWSSLDPEDSHEMLYYLEVHVSVGLQLLNSAMIHDRFSEVFRIVASARDSPSDCHAAAMISRRWCDSRLSVTEISEQIADGREVPRFSGYPSKD